MAFVMPIWAVAPFEEQGDEFVEVTCPRCNRWFVADKDWPGPYGYTARMCPYCSKASALPNDLALVYDGSETVRVTMAEARALIAVSVVAYSPEDGPGGIVFRPIDGQTVKDVYASLVRFN